MPPSKIEHDPKVIAAAQEAGARLLADKDVIGKAKELAEQK